MNLKMMFTQAISKDALAAVILWTLAMNRRPMSIDELCLWTASGDDKVRTSLKTLEGLEAVSIECRDRGMKWVSLATGCQDFLPGFSGALTTAASLPMFPDSGKTDSGVIDAVAQSVDAVSESGKADSETAHGAESGQKVAENTPDSGKTDSDPLVKLSKLSLINQEQLTRLTKLTSVKTLCEQSHLLFERNVFYNQTLAARDVLEALAWMAQVYDNRGLVNAPWGIVYHGLTRTMKVGKSKKIDPNARPEACYLENPFQFLPKNYLDAVGLGEFYQPVCEYCGRVEHAEICPVRRKALYDQMLRDAGREDMVSPPLSTPPITIRERVSVRIWDGPDAEIVRIWLEIQDYLKNDMPKASFETWVKDISPAGLEGKTLLLACRNQYAADWVQNRLLEHIQLVFGDRLQACGVESLRTITNDDLFAEEECQD